MYRKLNGQCEKMLIESICYKNQLQQTTVWKITTYFIATR